jgi:hypothetical protein
VSVETFVKGSKYERRLDRQSYGGVPGNGGAAKKPAACVGMTLWSAVSAFHGVAGALVHRAIAMHLDASMDVDAI